MFDISHVPPELRHAVIVSNIKLSRWQQEQARKPKPQPKVHDWDQRTLCCVKCWMSKLDAEYNRADCVS